MKKIIDLIRLFLIENRMTQSEFSRMIGYSEAYVNRVLNGKDHASEKFKSIVKDFINQYKPPEKSDHELSAETIKTLILESQAEIARLKKRINDLEALVLHNK